MSSTDISNVIVDQNADLNAISLADESSTTLATSDVAPTPLKKRSAKAVRENRKETISTIMALGLESFKVFMACMLSLFVSQNAETMNVVLMKNLQKKHYTQELCLF